MIVVSTARGLAAMLCRSPRIHLLDTVDSIDALQQGMETNHVSVVICDLHLLGRSLSGPAAIRYIDHDLGIPVVAWSGASGFTAVADAIGAGAFAFVSKDDDDFSLEMWVEIIEATNRKEEYLTSTLATFSSQGRQAATIAAGARVAIYGPGIPGSPMAPTRCTDRPQGCSKCPGRSIFASQKDELANHPSQMRSIRPAVDASLTRSGETTSPTSVVERSCQGVQSRGINSGRAAR